uniref:J domain-containing protein n=1 Tax=Ditylenchus dipsaci TaxID=166011 RepID=A0A915ET87_9BILA
MVIEANRDAARECVQKAGEAMRRKDMDKMRNLLARAKKLDPDCDVDSILRNGHAASTPSRPKSLLVELIPREIVRRTEAMPTMTTTTTLTVLGTERRVSTPGELQTKESTVTSGRAKSRSKSGGREAAVTYTKEQVEIVNRIRHCKDYYEILTVQRDVTDTVLKKKYYEMALKLHPDKCKAPGATEAFKALGNAYGVLSDPKKREDYDKYGSEDQRAAARRSHHRSSDFYEFDVGRGFEAEMSPEDIFEMFFGGGMFNRGPVNRRRAQFTTQHHHHREEQPREETSPVFQLLQILPILVIIFGGLIVQFFAGEPAYSLNRDNTFHKLKQVEQHVEDDYLSMLRNNCYREKIIVKAFCGQPKCVETPICGEELKTQN